ncbi:hypothetical protein [Blastococcus sp. CCUG 61487]|uniref:hypothetical protein n=1 Tax=Blastococcus sp. CCUG 61487 TaxID=1840703 RepID=UPI0010BF9810|nr:hypothetical protein [Blastococcus sp. CCUG 61487]TKJ18663.1 hypothetical protein A6V29_11390 [Blastococcus sp. CCUG 61487]
MDANATLHRQPAEEQVWTWPPHGPEPLTAPPFDLGEWAPASTVRHPWVRVGRFTLLYRRAA